eukprot:TRINITY_DN10256_c0_g1_i1.p1 TRINITY_DN10256_c0_g1~~TRINITY_DN10256_c0_g1_i1.p1  ORF type:complete len:502 (+),score=88.72 TRINITY_DN10256_c0_g1_i1:4-1509(+)
MLKSFPSQIHRRRDSLGFGASLRQVFVMPRVPQRAAQLADPGNLKSKRPSSGCQPIVAPQATVRPVRQVRTKVAARSGLRVRQNLLQLAQKLGVPSVTRSLRASSSAAAANVAMHAPPWQSQAAVSRSAEQRDSFSMEALNTAATAVSGMASSTAPARIPLSPQSPRSWSLPAATSPMLPQVLSLVSPSPVTNPGTANESSPSDRGADSVPVVSGASALGCDCNVDATDADFHYGVLLPSLRVAERGLCSAAAAAAVGLARMASPRRMIVDWMLRCHDHFGLVTATLFLAVRLLDGVLLQVHTPEGQRNVQNPTLLGAVTLLLASKFEEEDYPATWDLANFSGGLFSSDDMHLMEVLVLEQLEYRLHMPTAFHHLHWCTEVEISRFETTKATVVHYLAQLALRCEDSSLWAPSDHAAAALTASNLLFSRHPALSMSGDGLLRGDAASPEALCAPGCLVRRILDELDHATAGVAAFDKFAMPCRGGVALLAARLARGDPTDV